jgi:mannosyltransferase OCH1-like enzyme
MDHSMLTNSIHLLAPKNRNKWHPTWEHCYKFWENSNYNITMWDDASIDNLLKEDDSDFFHELNSLNKIFKLDYVRYLILEKFGGAYFDLDVEIKLDFLPSLSTQRTYLMEATSDNEIVQNSIMISLDKTPFSNYFWNTVKNYSKSKILNNPKICKDEFSILPKWTNVKTMVGPIMLSEVYKSYSTNSNIQLLSHLHFNIFPHDFKICIHHQTGKWGVQ